ncbi:MAG: amino acid ABC transporter substrate-binding protein [Rhodospirillaceae bacterium]|nr:amino acid ABC transporter substrate-binding protein [Rhodospirillaceae bacterium]MBT4220231.1 amino acid ABC transporter substrate-binding protein [Rhodospirillaceae bacterium]MBT5014400.1 amino acid ABC transporter substrate-binding protein [Rhodospirillaceae bacterium]MBT5307856.1 amino acid ABC transporter substrate-binding protein [Rhodospirillaceae bacterium]MBT7354957.1 amino acid ABC transporter substrate-binding protein [Rhodospirillaceae bacterium]
MFTTAPVVAGNLERIKAESTLRVCHWPAYYAISFHNSKNGKLEGIDIGLARELASDLGVKLQFVKTSFATFIKDIQADKCDIAMFGVGITESRAKHLDYSDPYLRSDIYAIVTKNHSTLKNWDDMDKDGHILVVQKGTFMEDAASAFKNASILSVVKFQQREKEVRSGRADAFLTDFPYGKKILVTYDWAKLLEPSAPFHKTEYAYAINKGDPEWLAYINGFVGRIKSDGRLKKHAQDNGLLPIAILD